MLNKRHTEYFSIIVIMISYAFAMNSGVYGWGKDFYASYSEGNIFYGGWRDRLGWVIATAKIGNIHLGIFITSFLLSVSTFTVVVYYLEARRGERYSLFLKVIILLLLIHTWPVLMSTSNAMRQGIMMSFLYFALFYISQKRYLFFLFCIIFSIISHKSGILFAGIVILTLLHRQISNRFLSIVFMVASVTMSAIVFSLIHTSPDKLIGRDYSFAFFIITIIIQVYRIMFTKGNSNFIDDYATYSLWLLLPLYFTVANYQYERIWMVNIIILLITLVRGIKLQQVTFAGLFILLMLVVVTGATGTLSKLS